MSSSKKINNNENSDINDGGALLSLLDIEFDNNTAISENFDNKLAKHIKSKNNRMIYDPNNRILISADQGIHGASKERLRKISKLHHRTPANIESHGLKGIGEKGYAFHFSDLYRDSEYSDRPVIDPNIQAIFDKHPRERTPIESLRIASRYISKTDELEDVNDEGLNCISLNVIPVVFQNAQYKNETTPAGLLDKALWNAFSIDPKKPGTISFVHVCQKRHEELMASFTSVDIEKSLSLFLSTHYHHQIVSENVKMEIGLVSFDIKNENGSLEIKKEIIRLKEIIPFDPLHFDRIEPKHKTSGTFLIYKKNKNIALLDIERLQYESEPKDKIIFKNENGEFFKMMIDKAPSKENKYLVKVEDIEEEIKYYIEFGKVHHKGTYEHDWKNKDDVILEEVFECSQQKLKNKPSLNGSYTNRNKKLINHSNPPNKSSGDFSIRKAYKNCRFERTYDSTIDEYIPPLLNKSKLAWNNLHEGLRDFIDLVEKEFREKIGKMYLPTKPKSSGGSSKKPSVKIESDSESNYDYYSETDDISIASSTKTPNPVQKNKEVSTNKPKIVKKQITKPDKVILDSDDEDSVSSVSSSSESENEVLINQTQSVQTIDQVTNISLTLSESACSSDSESSHSSKIEAFPTLTNRKANKVECICKKDFILELENWEQKENLHDELNIQLRILFKEYNILHEYSFEVIFNKLTIKDKIEIIINHINKKYPFEKDPIGGGINFHRAYNNYVK